MASRASYEQGGWSDGRLGQAFDLIDAVMRDHADAPGWLRLDLQKALDATEEADEALENDTTDRRLLPEDGGN